MIKQNAGGKKDKNGDGGSGSLSDIPLLDEVNDLLEKEKMLLGLKILEQKKEKEEWKAKYDQLLTRVSETGDLLNVEGAAKDMMGGAYEIDSTQRAAPIANQATVKKKSTVERVNDMIMSLGPREW